MRFERIRHADLDVFHRLCVDAHVRRYLLDGAVVPRDWAALEIVRSNQLFADSGVGLWLIWVDGSAVGFCGFRVFETMGPEPQLLYALPAEHSGRGHATRACAWMLERARELSWERVTAAVDEPNVASIRVLERNGFVPCGRVPGDFGHTVLFEWAKPPLTRIAHPAGSRFRAEVATTWNGVPIDSAERCAVALELCNSEILVTVDAPFFGDAAPSAEPGRTDRLWEHEVVELMLLGADDRYLEIELSPHGHYLVLSLAGVRHIVHADYVIHHHATISGDRWNGEARIPLGFVPRDCDRLNVYAIHGDGQSRRHLAWRPHLSAEPDTPPDFHRLETFGPFTACDPGMLEIS